MDCRNLSEVSLQIGVDIVYQGFYMIFMYDEIVKTICDVYLLYECPVVIVINV